MKVRVSIKTPFVLKTVPIATPPEGDPFDIRDYKGREWALVFMRKSLFKEIEDLCKERGLNTREVLYGTLLKLRILLKK